MVSKFNREWQCSLRSYRSAVQCSRSSGQASNRCFRVCGGCIGHVQLREGYVSDGGHARQFRKYPCPVHSTRIVVVSLRGRVV
jgi:hypothetical protein